MLVWNLSAQMLLEEDISIYDWGVFSPTPSSKPTPQTCLSSVLPVSHYSTICLITKL